MKDNLEDLLKQVYAQKEEPSQEFCQSVIQKMKGGNQKGFFLTGEKVYYKGILMAAICAGIIILAGIGIQVYRQGDSQNRKASLKQGIAQQGNQVPDVAEDPFGEENGVETESPTDGEEQSETKDGLDEKKQVETANPSDEKSKVETSSTPNNVQESSGANTRYPQKTDGASDNLSESEGKSSSKLREQHTGTEGNDAEGTGSDSGTGSGNQKPKITENVRPTKTAKPMQPSETMLPANTMTPANTMLPQRTPDPQGNYIALCSIEIYESSSDMQIPMGEEIAVPESVFGSKLILSYEQLQNLIGEIEGQLTQIPDNGLQNILLQLRKYDQSYFVSNALCVNLTLMNAGTDLNLQAVWLRNGGQGNYYLDICLDKVCDKTEQTSELNYYSSFISVPQTIAGQCNMVLFEFS